MDAGKTDTTVSEEEVQGAAKGIGEALCMVAGAKFWCLFMEASRNTMRPIELTLKALPDGRTSADIKLLPVTPAALN